MKSTLKRILLIAWLAVCTGIFTYWLVNMISSFRLVLDWLSRLNNPDFVDTIGQATAATMRNTYNDNLVQLSISLCLSVFMYASITALLISKIITQFKNSANH